MTSRPTSPQDKKALSYAHDRRNAYGQNAKASRKAIPRRKAIENRQDRRRTGQTLAILPNLAEEDAELVESSARQGANRLGGWRKAPDIPLVEHVTRRLGGRVARAGRKQMSKARRRAEDG